MAQSPSPCAGEQEKEQRHPVRANRRRRNRERKERGLRRAYGVGGGIEEGEAARAAGGAEAGVDGGVAVEVRAAAELLLVHLPRPHGRRRLRFLSSGETWTAAFGGLRGGTCWSLEALFFFFSWLELEAWSCRRPSLICWWTGLDMTRA